MVMEHDSNRSCNFMERLVNRILLNSRFLQLATIAELSGCFSNDG